MADIAQFDINDDEENNVHDDISFLELIEIQEKKERKEKRRQRKEKEKKRRRRKEKEKKRKRKRKEKEKEQEQEKKRKRKRKRKEKELVEPKKRGRPCNYVPGFINFKRGSHSWLRCDNVRCNMEWDLRYFNPNHICILPNPNLILPSSDSDSESE
jgi:hypothetical protein